MKKGGSALKPIRLLLLLTLVSHHCDPGFAFVINSLRSLFYSVL